MADLLQSLDPNRLVLLEAALSFAISPFSVPPYNLPIFLFGVYVQENSESAQGLKLFTGLLGGSFLYDIFWIFRQHQNWFIKLVTVLIFLLKAPTFFAFLTAMRQRGDQFPGLGIHGANVSGPTVWSMPGGFSSTFGGGRDGYQSLDTDVEAQPSLPKPNPPPAPLGTTPANHGSTAPIQ